MDFNMDLNHLRSIVTLLGFALFIALTWWTWRPSRKAAYEQDALLVFDQDDAHLARRLAEEQQP